VPQPTEQETQEDEENTRERIETQVRWHDQPLHSGGQGADHTVFGADLNSPHSYPTRPPVFHAWDLSAGYRDTTAPIDPIALRQRCAKDYGSDSYKLVLTQMDQVPVAERADLYSYGPTHDDIKLTPSKL